MFNTGYFHDIQRKVVEYCGLLSSWHNMVANNLYFKKKKKKADIYI